MSETSQSLLLRLADGGDSLAWHRLVGIYTPMIHRWLRRTGLPEDRCDDISQEVLTVVLKRVGDFRHNERTGAFRAWLRQITVNCLRDARRGDRRHQTMPGDGQQIVEQLADPKSELSKEWDREHDEHVVRALLTTLAAEFEPTTWQAFHRFVQKNEPATEVAKSLGLTLNAVYVAKSKVLRRLREEAAGLID